MRRLGGAAAAAAVLVLLTGCGSQAAPPGPTPTVTVVETPSATTSATRSATPEPTTTETVTATAKPSASSTGGTPADDPNRPADQCADADLGVMVTIADGGGGAGNEYYNVLFTNTGGSSCVLRGTPGVSVVGDGNGTQLGEPADRVQSGAKDVRLAAGETAAAPLKIVNIRSGGGPLGSACTVTKGDGYRVYPPHSKRAFFVQADDAYACTSSRVFMTASPVIRFTD